MSSTTNGNWYTNAYSGPFRSTRLRAPSLLPGARRPNVIPVQQTLVVDVAHVHNATNGGGNDNSGTAGDDALGVKRRETIFGPDVGEDDEPGWTDQKREQVGVDKVKQWVEKTKSEEGLHATTTLQALVNLKRPTLLLQQLDVEDAPRMSSDTAPPEDDIVSASAPTKRDSYLPNGPPLHLLKFNYDASTPQVRITLEVYPTPQPPIEGKESIVEGEHHHPKLVYTGLHQGGFAQTFTLPHTSALDLSSAILEKDEDGLPRSSESQEKNQAISNATPVAPVAEVPEPVSSTDNNNRATNGDNNNGRRRFGLFGRNREQDLEEGMNGIELTNTNLNGNDTANGQDAGGQEEKNEREIEQGVRLLIRIDGVGAEGQALKRTNAQLTHILISGTWVADNNASSTNTAQPSTQGKRVWVIKVVRREAMIGSHTFLLKEIYGLSSASTSTSTSYPPAQDDPYASTPNECIVCLTSPRDVVLLPCRHLVVCRDCAVGMVEYGAGGKVARRDESDGLPGGAGGENGDAATPGATGAGGNVPQVAGGTTTTGRERRKKKIKGWYCPVCRQPYTSLLRLVLPDSEKQTEVPLARVPSRAASVRTTRSGRAPSLAPTLPEGAERMLDQLRPAGVRVADDDDDEDEDDGQMNESERREWEQQRELDADAAAAESERREWEQQQQMDAEAARAKERDMERPQFVLANGELDEREVPIEEDEEKGQTEHLEHQTGAGGVNAPTSGVTHGDALPNAGIPALAPVAPAHRGDFEDGSAKKDDGKGWKEVA